MEKIYFPKLCPCLKNYEKWKINQQIKHFSNYVKPSLKKTHSQMSKQQVKPPPTRTFSPIKKIPTNVVNAIERPNIIQTTAFTYPTQIELKKMTQKCAAFPKCQFKIIQCGGTKMTLCTKKYLWKLDYTQEDIDAAKKQRIYQLRNTANCIKAIKQNKPTRKVLIPTQHEITDNIYVKGPHLPGKAFSIVEPIHIIALRTQGAMSNDGVINAYMNLIVHSNIHPLRIVTYHFLFILMDQKWEHAKKCLRETSYAKGTWDTSEIIFIPGFIGLNKAGHWINIIIDKTLDNKRIIFVADSCGIHNFDYIKSYFCNASFDHTPQSKT